MDATTRTVERGCGMTDYELSKLLHHIADALMLADRVSKQHNCNDCGIKKTCKYCPTWGEPVRINCPLWKKEEETE